MMKLKIGDQVVYRPWGKEPNRTAEVLSIEICKEGEKDGRSVKSVTWISMKMAPSF